MNPAPLRLKFGPILAVSVIHLVFVLGCEQPIPITNPPSMEDGVQVSGVTQRYSYDWPVNRTFFDSVAPSRLDFFDKVRDNVRSFLETQPLEQQFGDIYVPDGLSDNAASVIDRVKIPREPMVELCSITLKGESPSFALSRDGHHLIVFDSDSFGLWNTSKGTLDKTFPVQLKNVSSVVFSLDGKSIFAAIADTVVRFDLEEGLVGSSTKSLPSKVAQIAIASDLDKLAIRCERGEVFVTDGSLKIANQVPKAIAKSNVAISDGGNRMAFWNEGIPTEIELNELEIGRKDLVESLQYRGGERLVVCGRFTTQWVHGQEVFQWWHGDIGKNFENRRMVSSDLTWNPVQLVSTSPMENSDSRMMIALRKNDQETLESVLVDANFYSNLSSAPTVLPKGATDFCAAYKANRIAYRVGNIVKVFSRIPWQYTSCESFFHDSLGVAMFDVSTSQLDLIGDFILNNNFWWHYGFSSQDVFTNLAQVIGLQWINWEEEQSPSEKTFTKLKALNEWHKDGGDLARASSGFRRIYAAWRSVRNTNPRSFTSETREKFYDEMKKLRSDITPMLEKSRPCSVAYALLLFYTSTTSNDLGQIDSILEQSTVMHPDSFQPFFKIVPMLTEQWLGQSDDVAVFTRELRSLYGNDFGAMAYPRLCVVVSGMFPTRQVAWDLSKLNVESMIEGLDKLAEKDVFSESLYKQSFALYQSRYNADNKLKRILKQFYEMSAFVPTMEMRSEDLAKALPSNAARYHLLRFVAQLNGESPPDFFE
ncbi:WD40 repeat domain-containing protein [Pirellulaceae bacterium SH449]